MKSGHHNRSDIQESVTWKKEQVCFLVSLESRHKDKRLHSSGRAIWVEQPASVPPLEVFQLRGTSIYARCCNCGQPALAGGLN